jgi:O-antigen/teichoic acid export membrane protein
VFNLEIAHRFAKNTIFLFISQILSYFLGFIYILYAARYLGPANFGILSFALAFTAIFQILADLGLSTLTTREISKDKAFENKFINNIIPIKLILSVFTFLIIYLVINSLNYPIQTKEVVYILSCSIIFTSLSQLFYSLFQAYEKLFYQSLTQFLNSLFLFIGIIIAIYLKLNVIGFATIYLLVFMFIFILNFIILKRRFLTPKIEINFSFWKFIIKNALPLSFIAIFGTIAFRIDSVLLSLFTNNIFVGWYTASYKLIEALIFIPIVYTISIYPIFSILHTKSIDYLKLVYKKSFKFLFIIGVPISVGGTLLSTKIILFFYGTAFMPSILALQILIWSIPLIFLTKMISYLFASINKQNLLLKISFIYMCTNIASNIILIPYWGYIGCSFATLLSELIFFILCFYYISKLLIMIDFKEIFIKISLSCISISLFIIYVDINLFLQILFSTIIYFIILILLRTFKPEEIRLFKEIILKFNIKKFFN